MSSFLLLFVLFIIIIFCKNTLEYIYKRYKEKNIYINDDDNANSIENNSLKIYDMDKWLKKNKNSIQKEDNDYNISLCKGMVIEINNKENCNDISKHLCDGIVLMKKITIPKDMKIDLYSHTGYKLVKGRSYCIYKPPPALLLNNTSDYENCNETWGFWQYSLINESWQCKSKVPGIYDAIENKFNPCKKGYLYYANSFLNNNFIPKKFIPEDFYSSEFQKKFHCQCPQGYISRPDISRTTCFKDPCIANLPENSLVGGYDKKTGNCNCTPYFSNLYPNNLKSPCTACPNHPSYDLNSNILTLYIKCGNDEKFPCVTEEDKLRGCIKAKIKVKPKLNNDKNEAFKDLVFF